MKTLPPKKCKTARICGILGLTLVTSFGYVPTYASSPTTRQILEVYDNPVIAGARLINPTTVEIVFSETSPLTLDFYGDNIFRMFQDRSGGIIRQPEANPPAQILVNNPRKQPGKVTLEEKNGTIIISTQRIQVVINKQSGLFQITDLANNTTVVESVEPIHYTEKATEVVLKEHPEEYFYGGGVQNGRFSHKGKIIAIVNTNSWTDGGVASPTPFYWSTKGYGVMWHTFKQGHYDFGSTQKGIVKLSHDTNYLDLFFMVDNTPVALLNDFYQLTGHPVLLPKFGFYEGHLNAYNRDYWKEDEKGILFEDGKKYKESQKDNGGIKESLNGEKNNYQFSARAVIDRYNTYDMPLGWILPNDGYGAGYGQTGTLVGNIQNLKELGDYARQKGVEIGLWTQSDLHPKKGVEALLQRDIVREVRDAGVRVLKTDVAWVGAGYSFGLNGVADVANIMPYYGNEARPFIISLDGWAGTQRYAGIWTGDQTGGEWEYIRFHIPTYIGSGLSGQPNICSDMDGIFGGKNVPVNVRDFQWKTFTPMQLNMDGWGSNPKYPHILGEPATSINRWYLKMKSEFMPYTYSIAHEAIDGQPMIRAMFLDCPNNYTLGTSTRYQFMYGPYVLVAPVYQNTKADKEGNDIRNGIYLPEGNWIDYYTGELYEGNCILNNFDTPLWKLPLFVKQGAIIPMTSAHNNVKQINPGLRIYDMYPYGHSTFTEYDDDGTTEAYQRGEYITTKITSDLIENNLNIQIQPTSGSFKGMAIRKATLLRINATDKFKKLTIKIGGKKIKVSEAKSFEALEKGVNLYYYEAQPEMNKFATPGSAFAEKSIIKNPVIYIKIDSVDIQKDEIEVQMKGYRFQPQNKYLHSEGTLTAPVVQLTDEHTEAYALTPSWNKVENADYYEIEHNGMIYTTIRDTHLLFEDLNPETEYSFKVRAINKDGKSDWSTVTATTKANPLEHAITGVTGETSCENQGGQGIDRLFNFDESDTWHTAWSKTATPFSITIDLKSINILDKLQYLPRLDAGNGTLLQGSISYSMDKTNWTECGHFDWKGGDIKEFTFDQKPTARYICIKVEKAVGNFGSGRELYIFRVPGSESYLPGDINLDSKIDENDLTSYMNYTGLKKGDADFDYVSKGDLNNNGLIDAYDISAVATQLEGGVKIQKRDTLHIQVDIRTNKKSFRTGEILELTLNGKELKAINGISLALPYNTDDWEYISIDSPNLKEMKDMTRDRLHTDGSKVLYPTFVNIGNKPVLEGDQPLMTIRLKAKRTVTSIPKASKILVVDKQMNYLYWLEE